MTYSVFTPFERRFTDEIQLEREETIALYHHVRQKYLNSVWAAPDIVERISNQIADITGQLLEIPSYLPLAQALDRCLREIVALEKTIVSFPKIDWHSALLSMHEAVDLRRFLRAKEHFLANEDRVFNELQTALGNIMGGIIQNLPPIPTDTNSTFTVPLYDMMRDGGDVVSGITGTLMADGLIQCGLFSELQDRLYENVCEATGIAPYTDTKRPLVTADKSDLPAAKLLQTYLAGTPFLDLFLTPIPFSIPQETRFSGHWIVAPQGRGKTVLLSSMFEADIKNNASIIVMDSKGELINPIKGMKEIADRLVLIEPDADFPIALNPMDLPRASLINTIAVLEYVFDALLEAKFTTLQQALFRNVLPAIMTGIPNPTLDTFKNVILHGFPQEHFSQIELRHQTFFNDKETGFHSKTYKETRNQIVWRLDYLMSNDVMRAIFSAPKTKFDLGKEMDAGKIIVINNSAAILEDDGVEFFGRFFVALLLAAARQRSNRPQHEKLPCFCYIDEAHLVIRRDQKIASIIQQCRSQNIALILAHQEMQQIKSPDVLGALANCAIRMANSDDEAKELAPKLRTTPEFLQSLDVGTFATFVRDMKLQSALALKIPYTDLTKLPQMTSAEQQAIRDKMRSQYSNPKAQPPPRRVSPSATPPTMLPTPPDARLELGAEKDTEAGKDW